MLSEKREDGPPTKSRSCPHLTDDNMHEASLFTQGHEAS